MLLTEKQIEQLDSKIPQDEVSHREGGGGKKLAYLEGWYVINRLNKIFGQGKWGYYATWTKVHEATTDGKTEVAYTASVTLTIANASGFTDVGYGDGKDRNAGKAHESAVKEAVTDGLKRCAKNLGMSMGLALYDKTQENVDRNEKQPPNRARNSSSATKEAPKDGGTVPKVDSSPAASGPSGTGNQKVISPDASWKTREELNKLIRVTAQVAKSLRGTNAKAYMVEKYKKEALDVLTDTEATELFKYLNTGVS